MIAPINENHRWFIGYGREYTLCIIKHKMFMVLLIFPLISTHCEDFF